MRASAALKACARLAGLCCWGYGTRCLCRLLFTLVIVRLPSLVRSSLFAPLLKALRRCSALAAARHRPSCRRANAQRRRPPWFFSCSSSNDIFPFWTLIPYRALIPHFHPSLRFFLMAAHSRPPSSSHNSGRRQQHLIRSFWQS